LRLIEHGDSGTPADDARTPIDLSGDPPLVFLRLGAKDLTPAMQAIATASPPTAIVTGIAESAETTARARRLAREAGVAWATDPLLFRTGLPGYRTAPNLQALDYTPGRDGDPYAPDEFDNADLARRVGRSVIGAQVDLQASAAIGGGFVVDRIDDPWLVVNQRLLRVQADAAAAWNLPFIASLSVRMSGFEDLESQRLLVRALAARRPAAWLLMIDGLSEDSASDRVVAALRLALLLQASGSRVIPARAGDLRRLFLAFGLAGVEVGLGRLLRFAVPDYRKRKRGPGPTPHPRFELPSLCVAAPYNQARSLLAAELIAESECECVPCVKTGSLAEQLAGVIDHDVHVVLGEAASLRPVAPSERVDLLERALQTAATSCGWIQQHQPVKDLAERIDRQRRALTAGVEAGLLEPARLAAELRLFD
jgi:hypothetical protein